MKQKIVVFGATGMVGSNVFDSLRRKRYIVEGVSKSGRDETIQLDITNQGDLVRFLNLFKPHVIVNCAGLVGTSECNKDPFSAIKLNVDFVRDIAQYCSEKKSRLVHLSTVAVFDGKKQSSYTEGDEPSQLAGNWYNLTKSLAEHIARLVPDSMIVRIGDTYGFSVSEKKVIGGSVFSFAYQQLRDGKQLGAFVDVRTNQTFLEDIGWNISRLIEIGYSGKINLGGEEIGIGDFFRKIKSSFGLSGTVVDRATPESYQINRTLDLTAMKKEGLRVRTIDEGLNSLLDDLKI